MKRILFVSDMHVGHETAPIPKGLSVGNKDTRRKLEMNPYQKVLFKFWKDMCMHRYDLAVFMGDLIDGFNSKGKGIGLWSSDLSEQVEATVKLIEMINAKNMFFIVGTPYHVGDNPTVEEYIAEKLGYGRDNVSDEAILEICDGKTWSIQCSHKITASRSTWQYRATPVAREMLLAEMNRSELGNVDGIVRGHVHHFVEVRYGSKFGFTCPSWKVRDRYSTQLGLTSMARLGWIELELDGKKGISQVRPKLFNIRESGVDYIRRVRV